MIKIREITSKTFSCELHVRHVSLSGICIWIFALCWFFFDLDRTRVSELHGRGQSKLLHRGHNRTEETLSESAAPHLPPMHRKLGPQAQGFRVLQEGTCSGTFSEAFCIAAPYNMRQFQVYGLKALIALTNLEKVGLLKLQSGVRHYVVLRKVSRLGFLILGSLTWAGYFRRWDWPWRILRKWTPPTSVTCTAFMRRSACV